MAVDVSWYQDGRIIYSKYTGDVTIDDIRQGNQIIKQLAYEGTPLVHSIANLLEIDTFPKNLKQIGDAIEQIDNDVLGWTIIISKNSILRFLVSMVSQLAKARFRIFTNQDEAMEFLYSVDASLNTARQA